MAAMGKHPRLISLVPGRRYLSDCAGLAFSQRLQQDGDGLCRKQLVAAARRTGNHRAAKYFRRHLGKDAQHGLDVCAADRISRRRRGGHHRAAQGSSGTL